MAVHIEVRTACVNFWTRRMRKKETNTVMWDADGWLALRGLSWYENALSTLGFPCLDASIFTGRDDQLDLVKEAKGPYNFLTMCPRQRDDAAAVKVPRRIAPPEVYQLEGLLAGPGMLAAESSKADTRYVHRQARGTKVRNETYSCAPTPTVAPVPSILGDMSATYWHASRWRRSPKCCAASPEGFSSAMS